MRKCPTNYTTYNHCGPYSDYSKQNYVVEHTAVVWSFLFCFSFYLFFLTWSIWKKRDKWTPIGSVTLISCLLVFCFFYLSVWSACALVHKVIGTVLKWGRMKRRVKPLRGHNVPFSFSEHEPILEKGLGNLLFTWQCLTRNIILTGLILENSCACKDAHC